MASSTHDHPCLLPDAYATNPAPPPPTPSAQSHGHFSSTTSTNCDTLSRLLLRLPLTLSLPSRRSRHSPSTSGMAATTPPLVSLSSSDQLLSAATQLGFFCLAQHHFPQSHLLHTATLEAESLLLRHPHLPLSWPLGFDEDDDADSSSSFCFDITAPPDESFTTLIELASSLEKLGFEAVEALASGLGLKNPFRDQNKASRLMWVSKTDHRGTEGDGVGCYERFYPYVIGLHCKMSGGECSILAESGWVTVAEAAENMLVTVGDIAQVWSNGKLKKVRGRPVPNSSDSFGSSVAISFFLTLPLESIVSPLQPASAVANDADSKNDEKIEDGSGGNKFIAFSFEEYAWRVHHERLLLKDPLDRYRL